MKRVSPSRSLLGILLLLGLLQTVMPDKVSSQAIVKPRMTPGLRRDRSALIALKRKIYDYGDSRVRQWSTRISGNPCHPAPWPHILCIGNRIISIDLSGLNIRGQGLPNTLARMNKLWFLDLSGNDISGTIPEFWGRRLSFVRLQSLNLQDCSLSGTLPDWRQRGAWKRLRTLNLQGNMFHGQLPLKWAAPRGPLRRVTELDLSFNYLGKESVEGSTYLQLPDEWGSDDSRKNPFTSLQTLNLEDNYFEGSLPDWGKAGAYPRLRTLNLSFNRLTGSLPDAWGDRGSFKSLRFLHLAGNGLGDTASPGGLPNSWTRVIVPRAFPALRTVTLYPGNEYICTWTDGKVQQGANYKVVDDSGEEVGEAFDNMVLCPEPSANNPPTSPSLTKSGGKLAMSFKLPSSNAGFFCGFRASISDGSTDVLAATNYIARPSLEAPLTLTTNTYSVETGVTPSSGTTYTLSVATLFCDRFTSSSVTTQYTEP